MKEKPEKKDQSPNNKKRTISSREIRGFFFSEIGRMRRTVTHSMKGQPRRKPSGMHIEKW